MSFGNEFEVIFAFLRQRSLVRRYSLQYAAADCLLDALVAVMPHTVQITNSSSAYALLRSMDASKHRSGRNISQYPHGNVSH
jgi:hypothetical protein